VVVSTQHTPEVKHAKIEDFIIKNVVRKVLPAKLLTRQTTYLINPTAASSQAVRRAIRA